MPITGPEAVQHIASVPAAEWDALVAATPGGADNPFLDHAFLSLLEESGSVGGKTGWQPLHQLMRENGKIVAAMPFYVRFDSYGEYIFDWGWAEAAQRARIRYYPKCTSAIPFTPATGPRLLGASEAWPGLVAGLPTQSSGNHVLFLPESQLDVFERQGYFRRLSFQFHLKNPGFRDFQDFLDAFSSKRRKEILRERRQVVGAGVEVRVKRGSEILEEEWRMLRHFYEDTCAKMHAIPYLSERFFQLMPERLLERVVVALGYKNGHVVGGTLNFVKGKHLYGRYWGCVEEIPALHFECCYYALTEWAISQGITLFEAGAQGEHKLSRGFLPSFTWSAHRIQHPGLHEAIKNWVEGEAARVREGVGEYGSPFRS